jgi:hypothetical protein
VSGGVFLDSGIFIAFLNRRDHWHGAAVSLFNSESPPDWSTSWLVVSESYSWFLHRMGEESARTFRRFLSGLEGLRVFAATGEHHLRVVATLDRFRGSPRAWPCWRITESGGSGVRIGTSVWAEWRFSRGTEAPAMQSPRDTSGQQSVVSWQQETGNVEL